MFDVFYTGTKPNLFVFEQLATSLDEAAVSSRTDRKRTRLNSSHIPLSRMPSSA